MMVSVEQLNDRYNIVYIINTILKLITKYKRIKLL